MAAVALNGTFDPQQYDAVVERTEELA